MEEKDIMSSKWRMEFPARNLTPDANKGIKRCILKCTDSLKLHRCPQDNARREVWRVNLNLAQLKKSHRVCNKHFSNVIGLKKRLPAAAVPDLVLQETPSHTNDSTNISCVQDIDIGYNSMSLGTEECFTQTSSFLSKNTPRKVSLKKENLQLKEKIQEIEKDFEKILLQKDCEILSLKKEIELLEGKLHAQSLDTEKLPTDIRTLVDNSLKNFDRPSQGRRYGKEIKMLALSILFISPVAHRFLKPLLDLPSETTLRDFISTWPKTPGNIDFNVKSLVLKMSESQLPNIYKYCSISADEMSLRTHFDYNRKTDTIVGLEDFGDDNTRSAFPAGSVVVLMAQGIAKRWKHPLAYYFVRNTCPPSILKKILTEAINAINL